MMKQATILAAAALSTLVAALPAQAANIRVPGDYPTIQGAVDAAMPGDKIQVAAGNYNERVLITKSDIALVGTGKDTVIDGTGLGTFDDFLAIHGARLDDTTVDWVENVEISGFTVVHALAVRGAIGLSVARDCDIHHNRVVVDDTPASIETYGITLWDASSRNRIANNTMVGPGPENFTFGFVALFESAYLVPPPGSGNPPANPYRDNVVTNNEVTGWVVGIQMANTVGGTISNNVALENHVGLNVLASKDVVVSNNVSARNSPDFPLYAVEAGGIRVRSSEGVQILNNKSEGNTRGFFLRPGTDAFDIYGYAPTTDYLTVTHNVIKWNEADMVLLGLGSYQVLEHNVTGNPGKSVPTSRGPNIRRFGIEQ